jgi:hypothetical protein
MSSLERIIQEVRTLSPIEQEQLRQMLEKEASIEKLRRIQAKYAHLSNSSYDFAVRKAEEIEREDQK